MNTRSISKFRAGLFAAVLAVAPLSPALRAQDIGMIARINVPFAFETSSGKHFHAGVYTVRMENPHTLLLRSQSDSGLTMTSVEDTAQPAKTGKATFRKYGNEYFLAEITVAGSSRRLYFTNSKAESRMRIAANQSAPTSVEVAMLETAR